MNLVIQVCPVLLDIVASEYANADLFSRAFQDPHEFFDDFETCVGQADYIEMNTPLCNQIRAL
jgi:hypothetical protein